MNIDKYIRKVKVMGEVNKWDYQSLADAMGISRQKLYKLRTGKRKLHLDEAQKLAELLECTIEQLQEEDNNG